MADTMRRSPVLARGRRGRLLRACVAILLAVAMPLSATPAQAWAQAPSAEAQEAPAAQGDIASGTSGTCTWEIDADGGMTIRPTDGTSGALSSGGEWHVWEWSSYRSQIKTVMVESGVKAPADMSYMFSYCDSLTSIDLSGLDTSSVTDIYRMFYECPELTSLDLSNFDTSKITTMSQAFCHCDSLASLDVSNFDTSGVTDMSGMFSLCDSLASLDLSNFDTSGVTDMSVMFYGCSSLASLDVSGLDTSKVTNMSYLFYGCSSLTSLDLSGLDTSKVTNMFGMFYGCAKLSEVKLGTAFKFVGTNSCFPTPPTTDAADHAWTNVPKGLTYSATDLQTNYNGATMSGTWTWAVVSTITYAATTGGSVSSASESVAPATGAAAGSVATAAAGYHFTGWTNNLDGTTTTDAALTKDQVDAVARTSGAYVPATFTATFAEDDPATITYAATTGGSVSSASESVAPATGAAAGSVATAAAGYHFTGWTNNLDGTTTTDAALTKDQVDAVARTSGAYVPATFTATFAEDDPATITYAATTGGSVSSASESVAPATGAAAGSVATAAAGYHFTGWTNNLDGTTTTDAALTKDQVDAVARTSGAYVPATFTATFAEDDPATITYAATTGGSVSSASESVAPATGAAAGSVATAAAGYHFTGWTNNLDGTTTTDAALTKDQVDAVARTSGAYVPATFTATFAEDDPATITYAATTGGSVSSASESVAPATGAAAGSVATAAAGYHFTGWTNNLDGTTTTDAALTKDQVDAVARTSGAYVPATFTATFAEDDPATITYAATTGGSVSSASESVAPATGAAAGSVATAAAGYHFTGWTNNLDGTTTTDAALTKDQVDAVARTSGAYVPATFTATFAEDDPATITYAATTGGSVSSASESVAPATGAAAGSVATAAAGYHFTGWTNNLDGTTTTDAALTKDQVDAVARTSGAYVPATFTATFAEDDPATITYAATTGGSVSSASESVAPATGAAAGSVATAAAGYHFTGWTNNLDGTTTTDAALTKDQVDAVARTSGAYVPATFTATFEATRAAAPSGGTAALAATGDASGSTVAALGLAGAVLVLVALRTRRRERPSA